MTQYQTIVWSLVAAVFPAVLMALDWVTLRILHKKIDKKPRPLWVYFALPLVAQFLLTFPADMPAIVVPILFMWGFAFFIGGSMSAQGTDWRWQ